MPKLQCVTCHQLKDSSDSEHSKWLYNADYQYFCADCMKMHKARRKKKKDEARDKIRKSTRNRNEKIA